MSTEFRPTEIRMKDWPPGDRAAWDTLFTEGDILDGRGTLAHWREGTRRKCAQTYGIWLGFLSQTGRLDLTCHPTHRVTPEAVRDYIDATLMRCKPITALMRVVDLEQISKAMAPKSDWRWMRIAIGRLRHLAYLGEIKPRAAVSARELYEWGLQRMAKVEADTSISPKARAVRYREGLLVALLISRPIRLRPLLALKVGGSLTRTHSGFSLSIGADEMKDRKARDFPLPHALNGAMDRYLSHDRLVLLDGKQSDALWITKDGRAFSEPGFVGQLAKLTRREFGEALRPHAFRHIAATSVALEDPEHVGIITSILGHSTLSTSERYYNRAQSIEATHAYQGLIKDLRKAEVRERPRKGERRPRRPAKETA